MRLAAGRYAKECLNVAAEFGQKCSSSQDGRKPI